MITHLATHICSKNVVNTIDDYAEECGEKEKYRSLREVFLILNNFFIIMNGIKKVDCFSSLND